MRKILIVILAAAVVLGVPAVVLAASGGANSSLDLQRSRFTTTTATTSSRTFQPIPGLSGLNICALNQVTATLSGYKSDTKTVDVTESESVPLAFSLEPVKK